MQAHRVRGRRAPVALAAVVASTTATLLLLGGEPALASHVDCGEEITVDTTLDSNLVNCPNNGILIGADGITLDLNGHRIDGDGKPAVDCDPNKEFCDMGVGNVGHNRVTVKQGEVRGFAFGGLVVGARKNRVLRITATRNVLFGLVLGSSGRSVIRGNSLSHNIAPEGDGMGLFGCRHIRVLRNSIRGNAGPGIHVVQSPGNLIKGNEFARNSPAVTIEGNRNRVQRNRIERGGGILVASGDRNLIAGNRVSRAAESIGADSGHGNRVIRNVVTKSRGIGIRLGIQRPPFAPKRTTVRGNRVIDSGDDGFRVHKKGRHTLLKRNTARGSGDDGIDVKARATTLTANRAIGNADLGIEATRGVRDGGGNVAWGNGNPLQCTNVLCAG